MFQIDEGQDTKTNFPDVFHLGKVSTGLQHCKYAARSTADLLQILHFCNEQFWFLNFAANLQHHLFWWKIEIKTITTAWLDKNGILKRG
jgi:hypothetical protein